MDNVQAVTYVDKIRSYRAQCSELQPAIKALLEEQRAFAQAANKTFFRTRHWQHEGSHFVLAIHARPLRAKCRIYKMLPAPSWFEAVFFDTQKGTYHLFDAHFFQRYAERMKIPHFSHPAILKHYAEHNPVIVFGDRSKGASKQDARKLYALTRHGFIHAEQETGNVISHYTFINSHHLTGAQRRKSKSLRFRLQRNEALLSGK